MRLDTPKRNERSPLIFYKTTSLQQQTRELHSCNVPTTSTLIQSGNEESIDTPSHTIYEELKLPPTPRKVKHIKKTIRHTKDDTSQKYDECKPSYVRKIELKGKE